MTDKELLDKVGDALEEVGMGPVLMYLAGYSAHAAAQELMTNGVSGKWFRISKTLEDLVISIQDEIG